MARRNARRPCHCGGPHLAPGFDHRDFVERKFEALQITSRAYVAAIALGKICNHHTHEFRCAWGHVTKHAPISMRTLMRAIVELETLGVADVRRGIGRGNTNTYRLLVGGRAEERWRRLLGEAGVDVADLGPDRRKSLTAWLARRLTGDWDERWIDLAEVTDADWGAFERCWIIDGLAAEALNALGA